MRKIQYNCYIRGIMGFITVRKEGDKTYVNLLRGDLHIGKRYFPIAREDLLPLEKLPSPQEDVFLIVDKSTFDKHPERQDLLVPNIIAEHALSTCAFFTADSWL